MKKSFLFTTLTVFLIIFFSLLTGCGCSGNPDDPQNPSSDRYGIFLEDISLVNGQSFILDGKLIVDGEVVGTASFGKNDHSIIHVTFAKDLPYGEHSVVLRNEEEGKGTIRTFYVYGE